MKSPNDLDEARRNFLRQAGKIAVYTPPALLAIAQPSLAGITQSQNGPTAKGNNGLGQRESDPQPPGLLDNPNLWNDEPTSIPGSPNTHSNSLLTEPSGNLGAASTSKGPGKGLGNGKSNG